MCNLPDHCTDNFTFHVVIRSSNIVSSCASFFFLHVIDRTCFSTSFLVFHGIIALNHKFLGFVHLKHSRLHLHSPVLMSLTWSVSMNSSSFAVGTHFYPNDFFLFNVLPGVYCARHVFLMLDDTFYPSFDANDRHLKPRRLPQSVFHSASVVHLLWFESAKPLCKYITLSISLTQRI